MFSTKEYAIIKLNTYDPMKNFLKNGGGFRIMYDFEKVLDRRNTNCVKWDSGNYGDNDVIPMWVADMDFQVAPEIVEAMEERMKHPIFGYSFAPDSYYEAVTSWFKRRFHWTVEKQWIQFSPGVVPGINIIIGTFTKPGDNVIIQTPVYHPFARLIKNNGCQVVENPLIFNNGNYEMDFINLEKVINSRTKLLILCNPHNPVGRVWTKEELEKLGDICVKHNVIVVSDEIHGDIIYKPNKHTVFSTIKEEFSENSIVCTAPNKTFNIAGLQTANIIIKNEKLRRQYAIQAENMCMEGLNLMGLVAAEAAYSKGEQWYQELMEYLEGNLDFILDFFEKRIPRIKIMKPQGTYLLWLNCSELNMTKEELKDFFLKKCKVWFNEGAMFGIEGQLFQRMNIGTSRTLIKEALERIEREVNNL